MPWAVQTPDTWETANFEIYGVEPNAVLEIAIMNTDGNELWGGARAVGSSLERRVLLHRNDGGTEIMTMHVQADSLAQVELYADKEDKVKFCAARLLAGGELRREHAVLQGRRGQQLAGPCTQWLRCGVG